MTAAPSEEPRRTRATVLTMPPRPEPSPREPMSPPGADDHVGEEPGYGHGV